MKYVLALLLIALPLQVSALEVPEAPADYLLDQADILSESYETALKERLTTLEDETTAEIGVLTIESLEGDVLEWYSLEVARGWGIGQEEFDNGVLILISEGDRAVRIEVGYGLEGAVTDANSSAIINQKMIPEFREGDYEAGLTAGLDALIIEIENESENFLSSSEVPGLNIEDAIITDLIVIFVVLMFSFVGSVVGIGMLPKKKRKTWQKRPVLIGAGVLALAIIGLSSIFTWLLGIAALMGAQKMLAAMTITDPKPGSGGGGSWGSGSSFGGGSFGGGSSGGFGGGSFGGGGSSGRW
jgi:uncharacterized protein